MILAHLVNFAHVPAPLAMFFQESGGGGQLQCWRSDLRTFECKTRCIAIILFVMSIWSLAVMIDRWLYFNAARKQSRVCAQGCRRAEGWPSGRGDQAGRSQQEVALAEVVTAGLQEFRSFGSGGNITEEQVESSQRALERAEAIVHAKRSAASADWPPLARPLRSSGCWAP